MSDKINMEQDTLDLREMFTTLLARKYLFIKVACVTFVLSAAWIIPEPRTYTTSVILAPELSSLSGAGSLGGLAANFGFDLGNAQNADALYPTLYPDVIKSTTFAFSLFDVNVKSLDGKINTTYYDYLDKYQKKSFWKIPIDWVKNKISSLVATGDDGTQIGAVNQDGGRNEFMFSKRHAVIIAKIQSNIKCSVDRKTNVISFVVTDQDRLISATIADSVRQRLQDYIIEYRTRKTRVDVDYYAKMMEESKKEYEASLARYSSFADSHFESFLQTVQSKREALNNDVQMKLTTYNTVCAQYQQALAKLQERTPSFTIIQPAVVAQKPSGPKRMIFVAGMMILSMFGTVVYVLAKSKNMKS